MKRKISLFSFGCLFFLGSVTSAYSTDRDTILIPVKFEKPTFERASDGTLSPQLEGLQNTIDAGYPSVPVKTIKMAFPSGYKFKNMDIAKDFVTTFEGQLRRVRPQMPISWLGNPKYTASNMTPLSYEGTRYPEADVDIYVEYLHDVPIAIINVYPISESKKGEKIEISYFESIEISIFLEKDLEKKEPALASWQRDRLRFFIDNPKVINSYSSKAKSAETYDYLIITVEKFSDFTGPNSLKDFQNGLAARGLKSKIAKVSDIYKEISGVDQPSMIRNYIKKEYKNFNIKYVLLAGDGDTSGDGNMIPPRKLWQKIRAYDGGQWYYIEKNIPADLYYSCLDGDFNGDGDDKWGEPNDGENGKDVDLLAEVVVGRAPLSTTTDLQNFVQKTLWMYKNKVEKNAFLLGELLFASRHLTGGDYMDQLVGMCTDHNFQTNGYGPEWNVTKFYDEDETEWDGDVALEKISKSSFSMINHLGHSGVHYNMRLFAGEDFTNKTPFVYYTQGCYPGDFTEDACFIEELVNGQFGAVVAIANTSYGLAPEDPEPSSTKTPGASHMLHRQYINAIFTDHKTELGRAHQNSKEDFIGMAASAEIRWVFWVSNYFGDPSLELRF